uniref:Uncharacterized protein AlNc14C105G6185 n=1 Tax=Albugo laibachii Nc14 TaxID=890382 RepID=F0WHX8_9STRA|nr:conserved hypothetical protein [Albugo laibachii Nc14]|eukprot:CCA20855.1 conserved hypothetical protein [Albugo laibachii Nc14]
MTQEEHPSTDIIDAPEALNAAKKSPHGSQQTELRVKTLLQSQASSKECEQGLQLIEACREHDLHLIRTLIEEQGYSAGFTASNGWTAISVSAYNGSFQIVEYLLKIGADKMYFNKPKGAINSDLYPSEPSTPSDLDGDILKGYTTPLHWSCYRGHEDVMLLLLRHGHDPEAKDNVGNSCLHLACCAGNYTIVQSLLAHSVKANSKNDYGNYPMDLCITDACRRVLARFQSQTSCKRCKEPFTKSTSPSMCQQCHNVFCGSKSCSNTIHVAALSADHSPPRPLRYCEECTTEMQRVKSDLRTILKQKTELIRQSVERLHPHRNVASTETQSSEEAGLEASDSLEKQADAEESKSLSDAEILEALTLGQSDAEVLFTSIEVAQGHMAMDPSLLELAHNVHRQLNAHIHLQEAIQALLQCRPLDTRSRTKALEQSFASAKIAQVDPEMLEFTAHLIRCTEAECTLSGCYSLCSNLTRSNSHIQKYLKRLGASVNECQTFGMHSSLLDKAMALKDRLNAEIALEDCMKVFWKTEQGQYEFPDSSRVDTLLEALEMRAQKLTSALSQASLREAISPILVDECNNLLKQLKKEIREETKLEDERRRIREELASKPKKKGKKKKG